MNCPELYLVALDGNGNPIAGAKLRTTVAGSTTLPKSLYSDPSLLSPLPNPLIADGAGVFPQFFMESGGYRFDLQDADGVQVRAPRDYIDGAGGGVATSDHKVLGSATDTVADYLDAKVETSDDIVLVVSATTKKIIATFSDLARETMSKVCVDGNDPPGFLGTKLVAGAGMSIVSVAGPGYLRLDVDAESVLDGKVKTDGGDTQPGVLFDKLEDSATVTWELDTNADGHGYHAIKAHVDLADVPGDHKVKTSALDAIATYLGAKIRGGAGITITTTTDAVNGDQLVINSRTNSWRPITYASANYTVIDTDDTIVTIGPTGSTITIPNPSATYEGRVITVQAAQDGVISTITCQNGAIVGDTPLVASWSECKLICVSNGSTYTWISKVYGQI